MNSVDLSSDWTFKTYTSNIIEWMLHSEYVLSPLLTVTTVWRTGETGNIYCYFKTPKPADFGKTEFNMTLRGQSINDVMEEGADSFTTT